MDNNLEVLISARDNATPQLRQLQSTLITNKAAISELAGGTQQLGTMFLGLGVALKSSSNATAQQAGNMLAMVGGIVTAVGSTVRFVSSIAQMTSALKALNITQILANALAGPGGWAKLGIGLAVAGAATYGATRLFSGGGAASKASTQPNVTVHVAGSVVTERQLVDSVQRGLLVKQDQSNSTGIH